MTFSRRAGEGLKSARSLARSNYFCSAGFRKSVVYLSNMVELIMNIHNTVTSYIANAPDKNLTTKIGDEPHVSRTTTLQVLSGTALKNARKRDLQVE